MKQNLFKVIIAGSRTFNNQALLEEYCDNALRNKIADPNTEIVIISGEAKGADKLGEMYASVRNFTLVKFPANWDRHGKSAGYFRNAMMADYADVLIAFWDGKSRGTRSMIGVMELKEKTVRTCKYEQE